MISISLKGVEGQNFQTAREAMQYVIGSEIRRFSFLAERERLDAGERKMYDSMVRIDKGRSMAEEEMLPVSLLVLSELLAKHYGKEVIILIDEYDVPLDKAFQYGYYDEMVMLIRGLFGNALKSNSNLFFAVLTGCLRVSKESIFTGLNNFNIYSITNVEFDEYFGFTDTEVKEMLSYYGIKECYDTVKEWYDGYQFGETDVYCPWDVINYCKNRCADVNALPEDYWSNTSGNAMVRRFIDKADYCVMHFRKRIHRELKNCLGIIFGIRSAFVILPWQKKEKRISIMAFYLVCWHIKRTGCRCQMRNPDLDTMIF